MIGLIRKAVSHPVAADLLFLGILGLGGIVVGTLPREGFPEFSKEAVEVQIRYPSASPDEIARLCVIPVEEAADSLEGTDEIQSWSRQNAARVIIRLKPGTDVQAYLDEFRQGLDAIEDWPQDAEDPFLAEQKLQFPVVTVNLFGDLEEKQARLVAQGLRDRIRAIPHVASVVELGVRKPEIRVEVDPAQLQRFGVTLEQLSLTLGGQVRDLPGGSLETDAGEVVLRVLGEETDAEALARRPVLARPDGTLLRVGDMARVVSGFERATLLGRFNGRETVALQVVKDERGDVIDIVAAIEALVEKERPGLPEGLSLGISSDFSIYVKNRLRTLLQSGLFGLALVLIILWIFLDARIALMTALGIPVAVMGGILGMAALGISMNMLSMFAFILVLGLVVDDAIVVVENAYRHMERGLRPKDAALAGVAEVAWPVVTTVATTITAFGSMLMIQGELGRWMEPVPWVASLALAASLVEALIVLPAHFSHWVKPVLIGMEDSATGKPAPSHGGRWYAPIARIYKRALFASIRHRWPILLAAGGVLVTCLSLFQTGHLKFVMMPKFEAKLFMVDVEAPTSNSLQQTALTLRHFETAISGLPPEELESVVSLAGALYSDQQNYRSGRHLGQVFVELKEGGERTRSTEEIKQDLRHRFGHPSGVIRVDFTSPEAGPPGKDIELTLMGGKSSPLDQAADAVLEHLSGFPGVVDLRDDRLPGTREMRLTLTDQGRMLGFDESSLARQVLGAFHGDKAAILRLDREPADLRIRNPEQDRQSYEAFRRMMVRSPSGASLPLDRVARIEEASGRAEVVRKNRKRAVTVMANVTGEGNARDIVAGVLTRFAEMDKEWPGVSLDFGGDQERMRESMASLFVALLASGAIIFVLLALLFKSYLQPLVVLFSIPFALVGVFLGFFAVGEPLSFMTSLGVLALMGVAVNDALVLVDFSNSLRLKGLSPTRAILRAGEVRMRPVLITSLTTIGGLTPLAFFATGQANFLSPMAKGIVFGMTTATLMTLLLVPAGILVLEDVKGFFRRRRFSESRKAA